MPIVVVCVSASMRAWVCLLFNYDHHFNSSMQMQMKSCLRSHGKTVDKTYSNVIIAITTNPFFKK